MNLAIRLRRADPQRRLTTRGSRSRLRGAADAGIVILGDRRQIVSALHALLENAVVYGPEGSEVSLVGTIVEGDELPGRRRHLVSEGGQAGWRSASDEVGRAKVRAWRSATWASASRPTTSSGSSSASTGSTAGRSRETGGTGLGLSIVRHVARTTGAGRGPVPRGRGIHLHPLLPTPRTTPDAEEDQASKASTVPSR